MKKLLSLLLSMTMIMGIIVMPAKAEEIQTPDIYEIINSGIENASAYIDSQLENAHNSDGVSYGFEWYIISMLRAGKTIDSTILEEYYQSAETTVSTWTGNEKPTDVERTALALTVMGKDITDIGGVNMAEIIYNSSRLSDGSNELAYALIALDAGNVEIPDTALWSRESIIEEILNFQAENGGFGLYDNTDADVDMTAMCLQALAPYQDNEIVKIAVDRAVVYLRNTLSSEYNYSENSLTTAQVLLALACLEIDVTDESNGFGDAENNIAKAIEMFRSAEGNGYTYEGVINPMAAVQVLQAYDGYKKAHIENSFYWDFSEAGDNQASEEPATPSPSPTPEAITPSPTPEITTAEPIAIYVTIASNGEIVATKDGGYMAQAPVTVSDINADGVLTVDEALYIAHETYYDGGAGAGYSSYTGMYGLAIARLWGNGTEDAPASAGYYLNNASCWSLADVVSEGDYLTAFNYYDTAFWSDKYSYFTENKRSVNCGSSVTITLNYNGYDPITYAPVTTPVSGAKVIFLESDNGEELTTNAEGQVTINIPSSAEDKAYYVMAYKEDKSIVPAICRVDVKKPSGGSGSTVKTITAYISVKDPEGDTFLKKTAYSVESGTTAFGLLMETGLDVETTRSVYGEYVSSIQGLAEFDDGKESGWTYKVNGRMPDYSASSYILSRGDYVEWIYTRGTDDESASDGSIGATPTPTPVSTETPTEPPQKEFDENTFKDISADEWFYEGIKYVYINNLMDGMGSGFEPDVTMSRAMLVTVLYRLSGSGEVDGENEFADVNDGDWYYDAVLWAKENGIVDGITESKFAPNGEVTREQMALIFYRYCNYKGYDVSIASNLEGFSDVNNISPWALTAIQWANGIGLINGTSDSKLSPEETATRAQVATIFMRFCENIEEGK